MKFIRLALAAPALCALISCSSMNALNPDTLLQSGQLASQAFTLSDADVRTLSDKSCADLDKENKIAPASSQYTQRLNRISKQLGDNIDGVPVNYKVYVTKDVNAWAMANGCVRVYSGLMDAMNDDEVRGVVGHEMGHVALGHTKKAMQLAYATSAVRSAAASTGGAVANLSASQLGDLSEKFVQAQFSQSQESAADDYSFDMQKKKGYSPAGLVTAFQKLATIDGGKSSMMDSHPSSPSRAKHIQDRIASGK
ncbi:M48 family metallopeptidase [Caballeronia sp. GAFFF2]|jgi:putative metalloprotease|uniref:metalloprotease LoiP n=1 Tax=Caballeronia sp. GAFFF2 TaxID=2921741 RepID=UPI002028B7FE|nr:M48 family metallopeptidase [Caballeronia sp. GAFFF2]